MATCFLTGQDDWARAHGFIRLSRELWLGYALLAEISNIYETVEDKLEAHGE